MEGLRHKNEIKNIAKVLDYLQKYSKNVVWIEGNHENWVEQYLDKNPELEGLVEYTELLDLKRGEKVLEIGTGCGYQTAILCELGCEVYTIEIIEGLGIRANELLDNLGYRNVYFKIGDGYKGWEEKSPFDAIIVTASPHVLPKPLFDQLKTGGRMIIPIEEEHQELKLITKKKSGLTKERITPVRFVPMTGEAEKAVYN